MDPVVSIGTLAVETDSLLIASKVAVSVGEADAVRGVVVLDGQRYRGSTIQQFEQHGWFGAEPLASMSAIETEADYNATLAEVEALMTVDNGTPEADRLDRLVTLVEDYEDKHYPMDDWHPVVFHDLDQGQPARQRKTTTKEAQQ